MADTLWDLTCVEERVAAALWKYEAERAAPPSVAKRRTPEAFQMESEETRRDFLGVAGAALEGLFTCGKRGEPSSSDILTALKEGARLSDTPEWVVQVFGESAAKIERLQRLWDVDTLAQAIRAVDGLHNHGAGALAEAIIKHMEPEA